MLMPCGFHLAGDGRRVGAGAAARPGTATCRRSAAARSSRVDGSAYFSRPGPRVIDGIELLAEIFDPTASRTFAPVGSLDARRRTVGAGRCRFARASTACGAEPPTRAGPRTTSRAGRSSAPTASARPATTGSCASGCAQAITRAWRRPAARWPSPTPATAPAAASQATAALDAEAALRPVLRGARRRVRRLVPAPRPIRARRDPRRRLGRRARHGRAVARRAPDPRRDRGAGRRDRLVVAAPRQQGRAVALRRERRDRSTGRATASSPTGCVPTSTCATRGPSRIGPVDAVFAGFWLSHVPRARLGDVPGDRAALAQARRPVRLHRFAAGPAGVARPTTRRPPTTSRSAGSTTAASSRSSRSTTRPPSWRPRCRRPGFEAAEVTGTGRFFVTGTATT